MSTILTEKFTGCEDYRGERVAVFTRRVAVTLDDLIAATRNRIAYNRTLSAIATDASERERLKNNAAEMVYMIRRAIAEDDPSLLIDNIGY